MNTRQGWVASRALPARSSPALAMPAIALTIIAALALAGCTSNSTDGAAKIAVTVTDDACTLRAPQAPAGHSIFTAKNSGSKVAEFYVCASDGTKIIGEVENVGPGISHDLVATLDAGTYVASCDPGMDGDDIRADGPGKLDAGLFFIAFVRDPRAQYVPMQEEMSRSDRMTTEYPKTVGSALFAVPPGIPQGATLGDGGAFVGQSLFA